MRWFDLVISMLAVWRLALLVSQDKGPFRLFHRLRELAGAYVYGEDGEPESDWGALLSCTWCLSVWFAVPWAIWLVLGFGEVDAAWRAFTLVLALSGAVAFLHGLTTGSSGGKS